MTSPRRRPVAALRRAVRSTRLRALLALGVVVSIGATGTLAYWTDTVEVSGATLTTGTLDLQVNGADPYTGFTALSLTGMYPGTSSAGVLTVQNVGTVPLSYTMTSGSSTATLSPLTLKVTADTSVTNDGTLNQTCPGAALAGTGGALPSAGIATARTLQPGSSETLCLQVTLGTDAPDSAQGRSSDLTFTLTGTQLP
ncbi:putative ribosomally synthesized peptide with SipW-like signal peptide [Nocardioides luteus]|uniref:SipW-dependent-type signal peptide-containing protein n=1 Tax=Nocardioides luteus TaxID=1844 RepID=UPI0016682435|nr:SipW-dependent-type signal peptide-containing protein [Nocardioides luteus]MDR7310903.1 putative ribosomally synthesized peptide with SipW-like signal peptide [Nocardioides luteus]